MDRKSSIPWWIRKRLGCGVERHPLEKSKRDSRTSTLAAIEKALVMAGIEFLPAEVKGEGVRLRSAKA
jgi:hypothetical protein